ncbi:ATP-binding protein [Cryptosporangium sp. NPDC051539]|uniref:sensor histidine kinase n=1 Tax=Cryptosporangium sp. NPDC051539 TaxID=3363962 RepID=UPI00378E5526
MSVYPAVVGKHARLPHWASLPVIVAVLGVSTTLLVTGMLHQSEQRRAEALLDRQALAVEAAVSAEANRYVDTMTDLSAAIGAQAALSPSDFAAIVSGLSAKRLYGASAVSLVMPAGTAELPDLGQIWSAPQANTGHADPLAPGAAPSVLSLPHRYVVLNRTLDGAPARVGRDAGAIPAARQAMDLALQRGRPTASATFVLRRDVENVPANRRQLSFVVAAPVRLLGNAGTGELRGWLLLGMRGQDFLQRTLQRAAAGQVQVELRDAGDGTPRRVASWPRNVRANFAESAPPLEVQNRRVDVAGRTWLLTVSPVDGFVHPDGTLDTVVLVAGTLIALLLAGLVGTLSYSRARAFADVDRATAALRADVARREDVERALRRREKELAGFAGVAAHDLRTPLTAASAYLEVLAEDTDVRFDPQSAEFLDRARSAVARTDRMLTDLLGYATADQVELRRAEVDLGRLVADVVAERTDRLEADPRRVVVGELPVVSGDPNMIRQVLDNLIGNALKYTAPGQPPRVSVTGRWIESGWSIEVADRGIGIPPDERAGVFDAFHRGQGSGGYSGSGLGLAICRRAIERHGGMIGVDEHPGGGSLFWFTLPG